MRGRHADLDMYSLRFNGRIARAVMDHELAHSAPGALSTSSPDARQPLRAAAPAAGAADARSAPGAPARERPAWRGADSPGAGPAEPGGGRMAGRVQRENQRVLRVLIGHSLGAAGAAAEAIAHPEARTQEE